MWWGSSPEKKEGENDGASENIPVTPRLLPSQSIPSNIPQPVPLPIVVPDVQDLKEQFQQQQSILTHIKETIKENESQLSSKGKQVEAYATKLSQIKARSKMTQGKTSGSTSATSTPKLTKRSSKENLAKDGDNSDPSKSPSAKLKLSPKGKMSELKKRLEENKIKFEERTGKELSETKRIETLVEHLQKQLEERDLTIQDLQKTIEQPLNKNKADTLPRRSKSKIDKENFSSKSTQTMKTRNEENLELISLQNRIFELETVVMDLEENLKEKESIIEARTQAVTLLSQDLSMKGKNTLDHLEETRQEMRSMQSNFVVIQDQLQKELLEKEERLTQSEEKINRLELLNNELNLKNSEQAEKLENSQARILELEEEKKSLQDLNKDDRMENLNKKIEVLTKELDDSNKLMIKMKLEHKNKVKNLNKTIEKISESSDDKAEILRLEKKLEELEAIKEKLDQKVAELEEEKASEIKLQNQIADLENRIKLQSDDLDNHLRVISNLESEKLDLIQSNQDQNILIENLYSKIQSIETENQSINESNDNLDKKIKELNDKIMNMETEHNKEIEMLESYYSAKGDGINRKELEEYRISNELNNIHVEEQIELLVREKQQLLEKLKNLSGVSSTDSLTFEKMEHSDLKDDKDSSPDEADTSSTHAVHTERIRTEQQAIISELQASLEEEKEKAIGFQNKIAELEETVRNIEEMNSNYKLKLENLEKGESAGAAAQKSNVNAKNKLKKIQNELTESKKIIKDQSEKIEELNSKLEEKEQLIKNYIEKIESFEKDDWGRENDWKTSRDDFDNVQELQKKCLSLENGLIELSEDCERLRKENIEVVHLLSEEKVRRKKLEEKLEAKSNSAIREIVEAEKLPLDSVVEESVDSYESESRRSLEERIGKLDKANRELEEKVRRLETNHLNNFEERSLKDSNKELQDKLEWSNVVITGKETEIFRLQNLLEDNSKMIENLERDLKEARDNLVEKDYRISEILQELDSKDAKLEALTVDFESLKKSLDSTHQESLSNVSRMKKLEETVRDMEEIVSIKEKELEEIRGDLAEKTLKLINLTERIEANNSLSNSYKEHLENMGKCLRDKENEFEELLTEKASIEEINRTLLLEREELFNLKIEATGKIEEYEKLLQEKEKIINELKNAADVETAKNRETEELKTKMKKLAANLKKKAQNEKDLLQRVKEFEDFVANKDEILQKLEGDLAELGEKLAVEKSEKEKFQNEFAAAVEENANLINSNENLKQKLKDLETEYENRNQKTEFKFQQMETQLQKMYENAERSRIVEEQNKFAISELEKRLLETNEIYEGLKANAEEERKRKEESNEIAAGLRKEIEAISAEKAELTENAEKLLTEISILRAKRQEDLALIDSLEIELSKISERLEKRGEEFSLREERIFFLEKENENVRNELRSLMKDAEDNRTFSDRVDELLNVQKQFEYTIQCLKDENASLKNSLEANEIANEKGLGKFTEEIQNLKSELRNLEESGNEKNYAIETLTNELEKSKSENRQKSVEIERLNEYVRSLDSNLKDNIDNIEMMEKSHRHKMEELLSENKELLEKCVLLEEKTRLDEKCKEEKKPAKRKSVTFRTDEVEYIKELKNQIHGYNASLKQASAEIEKLKSELLREKVKHEVSGIITEAKEKAEVLKSRPKIEPETEKKFNAVHFFGSESSKPNFFDAQKQEQNDFNVENDSLTWDDGWGTDGHLEEQFLSAKERNAINDDEKVKRLEKDVKELEAEKEKISEELKVSQVKYSKLIKKLKEQKAAADKLQAELNKQKTNSGLGDLDAAIIEEFKSQTEKLESKIKELTKEIENSKVEKENLLKRIDVLNAGNEKFLEMKERQDNSAQLWELKNKELINEIADLRNRLNNPVVEDENSTTKENRELKNKIEGLEWEICELKELLEEKQEQIERTDLEKVSAEDKSSLLKEVEELKKEKQELEKEKEKLEKEKELEKEELEKEKELKKGKELEKEKEELEKEKEELEKEKEELEKKKEELVKKLQNSEEIEELREQVTALASENESLQEILNEMKNAEKVTKSNNESSKIFDYFSSSPASDFFSSVVSPPENEKPDRGELETLRKENATLLEKAKESAETYEILRENFLLKDNELYQCKAELEFLINEREGIVIENQNLLLRLKELQDLLLEKEEHVKILNSKIEDLEKSYNDSKFEIERLLNEEKLNSEVKISESLPEDSTLKSEIETLTILLNEEKARSRKLLDAVNEKEKQLYLQNEEITNLNNRIVDSDRRFRQAAEEESRQRSLTNEYSDFRDRLEKMVADLQNELESSKMELSSARREFDEMKYSKEEAINNLRTQLKEIETELADSAEKKEFEIVQLKCEMTERTNYYEKMLNSQNLQDQKEREEFNALRREILDLENEVEVLKSQLKEREIELSARNESSNEEHKQIAELRELLEDRDRAIEDLKQTLRELQSEMTQFRNFEKQIKELRQAQTGSQSGDPDLSDWSEHELAELNTRLQSDLDTALYMLHQRDVKCDELTFELTQLLEERDTLQLRLSTAIRVSEELRSQATDGKLLAVHDKQQESKDILDQSNDRQAEKTAILGEDLNQLEKKISELHSVGYIRDKTIRDDTVQRHKEQMSLLGRISESNLSLSRDVQNSPTVLMNWIRGKNTPKVMHI